MVLEKLINIFTHTLSIQYFENGLSRREDLLINIFFSD